MYTLDKMALRLTHAWLQGYRDMVTQICINSVHSRNLTKAVATYVNDWDKSDDFWKAVASRKEIAKQNMEAAESVL